MSKIIAICGKICCGKSYYAKQIKEQENAVILSIDEVTYDLIDNEQGELYDAFAERINKYLMKKAVEIVKAGCNVILDWGFWTKAARQEIAKYFNQFEIDVEWHYVDIEQSRWKQLIEERNNKIKNENGGSDFYVDEGLLNKMLSKFEEPTRDEMDIWIENK
ncbi:MAG: ATP-binding protein [Eubacteriales bacterium]|nr:ATP-binding protein [Eubacteriales bacterium]